MDRFLKHLGVRVLCLVTSIAAAAPMRAQDFGDIEDDRIVPLGVRSNGQNLVQLSGNRYQFGFTESGGGDSLTYFLDKTTDDFKSGVLRIEEATTGAVVLRGGQRFRYGGVDYEPGTMPSGGSITLLTQNLTNGVLKLTYRYAAGGVNHGLCHEIGIEKKSLYVRTYSLTPQNLSYENNFAGFYPIHSLNMEDSRFLRIPFMENIPVTLFDSSWFFSTFPDVNWSRGAGRVFRQGGEGTSTPVNFSYMTYAAMNDGTINHPVGDTLWVTVSSKVEDVFVDTDRYPMSAHRAVANRMAVVRHTGAAHSGNNRGWQDTENQIWKLHGAGFFFAQHYLFNWGHFWINVNEPTHYPAKLEMGSEAEYESLLSTIDGFDGEFALYYTFQQMDQGFSPGQSCHVFSDAGFDGANPSYNPTYLALKADLTPHTGFDNTLALTKACGAGNPPGHPIQVLDYKHRFFYVLREYGLARELMGPQMLPPTFSYLDAGHKIPQHLDLEAGTDKCHNMRDGMLALKASFIAQKAMTGGSLIGEGTMFHERKGDLELSGYSDGVRHRLSPPDGIDDADWYLMPDYNLKVIRPKTLHHSMGPEPDFVDDGTTDYDNAEQDAVRCAEIVYGQGIYMQVQGNQSNDFLSDPEELRAYYHITSDLQSQLGTAGSVTVSYDDGGNWLTLKEALVEDYAFESARLRIEYDNGLTIYANAGDSTWTRVVANTTFLLDKDCWVAHNSQSGYLSFSARVQPAKPRFDYVYAPGRYEMIDGRGTSQQFGGISSSVLKIEWVNGFTVTQQGSNDFNVTGTPPTQPPVPTPTLTTPEPYDAKADYRSIQGLYGWFYRAYNPGIAVPLNRPYWGKYHRYPEMEHSASANAYSYPGDGSAVVTDAQMTPGASADAVKGWIAISTGSITISGHPRKLATGGDGVTLRIRDGFEGPVIWSDTIAAADTSSHAHHLLSSVGPGDVLLFEVDGGSTNAADTVEWVPVITHNAAGSQPLASFSATPTFGTAPLQVSFFDRSTDNPSSWQWDLGNGTSTQQNPTTTYTTPGTYAVSLTVANAAGSDSQTRLAYIVVQ